MTPEEFAAYWTKGKMSKWQGGPETALAWAQSEVSDLYSPHGSAGVPLVSHALTAESVILGCWVDSDIRRTGHVSDALADVLLHRLEDWGCDVLARNLVYRAATEGWSLPQALRAFAASTLGGEQLRGTPGDRYWKISARNRFGALILAVLTVGFGLRPTKNAEAKHASSACDVLVEATTGMDWAAFTYNSAADVWRNRTYLWKETEVMIRASQIRTSSGASASSLAQGLLAELDACKAGKK